MVRNEEVIMLVFSTCLPLKETITPQACMTLVLDWVSGHPDYALEHLEFDPGAFHKYQNRKVHHYVFLRNLTTDTAEISGCRIVKRGRYAKWNTDCIYFRENGKPSILIQVFRNCKFPPDKWSCIKKPSIVDLLLEKDCCRTDSGIPVSELPLLIEQQHYQNCVNCLKAGAAQELPAVLVSCDRFGNPAVHYPYLAAQLGGMAYVFAQKDPETSKMLKADTHGRNVQGGSIGIYYPGESEYRTFDLSGYADNRALNRVILDFIRTELAGKQENMPYRWDNIVAMQAEMGIVAQDHPDEEPAVCSPV